MVFKNIGRFAGGLADYFTDNRYDFDRQGSLVGNKPVEFMPEKNIFEKDDDDDDNKGFLDNFLLGLQSYNPEKNKTENDKLLESIAKRNTTGGGGSVQQFGNISLYNPDNSAREQAILQQNQYNAQQAAQKKQNTRMAGSGIGTAIGSVVGGPVGGAIGGFIGGLFCDIRLKEDIAPLCVSEVNDVLSECAFFVKNLNECS